MENLGEEPDLKSQLVTEICSVASTFTSCVHLRRQKNKPAFVNWYRVLRIEEDAGAEIIRKRYRQLALQLHPDKNKHPKAEIAFKLVSEAYACLSDEAKRRAFDCARWESYCMECSKRSESATHGFTNITVKEKVTVCNSTRMIRSYKVLQALKEVRERFKEEVKVIETCLRVQETHRKEHPLFDPFDYSSTFPQYGHHTNQPVKTSKHFRYLHTGNIQNYSHRQGKYESPIYEIR